MNKESLKSIVALVKPTQLEQYLISTDWVKDGELGKLASIWHLKDNLRNDAELILPQEGAALDYNDRLVDLIVELSNYEKRTPADLVDAIANFSADLIRVRVVHDDLESGTIPLDDGVLLHEKTRDLMISAALSTSFKRKHFVGGKPIEINEYISRLRLGQTEIGSYVINIIVPLEQLSIDQVTSENTTFSRMVTHNLAAGLHALSNSISKFINDGDISTFNATVPYGASANMCEALIGLAGRNKHRSFVISVAPSSTQKMPSENLPLEFKFDTTSVTTLEKAVEFFKENYVIPNQKIIGKVKRLDRSPESETGIITVTCQIKDIEKNVTIELFHDDYIDAIHAHEQKHIITCFGELHVSPRSAKLLSPHNFVVNRNGELF